MNAVHFDGGHAPNGTRIAPCGAAGRALPVTTLASYVTCALCHAVDRDGPGGDLVDAEVVRP